MAEKRSSRRWSQRLRVNVWEHGSERPTVGYTENVSAQGLFLSMPSPLRAGTRVRLEVLADEQTFMTEGVVAHVRRVPRELQKVKQAGIGVSLLPFECFLRDVRPSGVTMTASGVWRMDKASLRAASEGDERTPTGRAAGGRAHEPAPSTGARNDRAPRSTRAPSPRPAPNPFAREDPHQRVSSAKLTLEDEPVRSRSEDDALLYPVRFDGEQQFLRLYDTDVRMGIFFVRTRAPAPPGARVTLDLLPPGARRAIRLVAESVRAAGTGTPESGGMLVRFLEPSAAIDALGVYARALRERGGD